jgi:hypothetical protein
MDDMLAFDSDFVEEGRKLFREMGVPDDIARIYLRGDCKGISLPVRNRGSGGCDGMKPCFAGPVAVIPT